MTTYGPFYPSSVTNESNGGVPWNHPEKAQAEDAAGFAGQAFANVSGGGKSAYLKATGFDFSGVPDDAVLVGVRVEWKKRMLLPLVAADSASRLVKAGTIDSVDHSAPGHWPAGLSWVGYGSSTDTLGLTVADVKDSGFGAALAGQSIGEDGGTLSVDACRITVWTE